MISSDDRPIVVLSSCCRPPTVVSLSDHECAIENVLLLSNR